MEGEWRWYCMMCDRDLGPMVGKHETTCPVCKCRSAYCTRRETGGAVQLRLEFDGVNA